MARIVIIDDDRSYLSALKEYVEERYHMLQVETCTDPVKALGVLNATVGLLIIDFEMPGLDGAKVFRFATQAGISKNRIIIVSSREANYLHERFPLGTCLAVLNKHDVKQRAVLDMVLSSLERKAAAGEI